MATAESNRAIPAYQTGPVDRLGRGQRMRQESNLQGGQARPVQAGFRRRSDCASVAEGGGHAPQRSRAHPGSGRGCSLAASPSAAEDGALEASACAPVRVPDDAGTLTSSSSKAESGELESHTCGAHSLAARPGALPVRSPYLASRPWPDSNRRHQLCRLAPEPLGHKAMK